MHTEERLHALDAVRAFALLLGILFHASASFIDAIAPGGSLGWFIADSSQSWALLAFAGFSHLFRMTLFFFIAGYFAHLLYHRRGLGGFAQNRWVRIGVPLVVGWCALTPLHRLIWWWANRRAGGTAELDLWPSAAQWASWQLPLTHLWFLYYLLLFYVVLVGLRHLVIDAIDTNGRLRVQVDRALSWAVDRRLTPIFIAIPVAVAACFAPEWNSLTGMPTPSNSLIPELIPSIGYGASFLIGWLFRRNAALLKKIETHPKSLVWPALSTLLLLGVTMALIQSRIWIFPGAAESLRAATALFGGALAFYINFAIIRFALRKFSAPNPKVRYVSDASYWMYIAHIAVVVVLQVWVAQWPIHWSVKFPLIVGIAFALLLASYHYLVRYTFIGAVLNGRRYRH
jgi:peptidoglycan/LPS O-acetylase OafA/YrhL